MAKTVKKSIKKQPVKTEVKKPSSTYFADYSDKVPTHITPVAKPMVLAPTYNANAVLRAAGANVIDYKPTAEQVDKIFKKIDYSNIKNRNEIIDTAIDQVLGAEADPNKKKQLETLLRMTNYMENKYGEADDAWKNKNVNYGFTELDKISIDNLFKPKGDKGNYTKGQKNAFEYLKNFGLPTDQKELEKLLLNNDPLANMAVSRLVYATNPKPLPDMNDQKAVFNYWLNDYNHRGAIKYHNEDELFKIFQEGYNKYNSPNYKPVIHINSDGTAVIDDNRGQWEHPGEVTRIASNDITMKGVPYPVLGVGADGEQRMMYPNEEHTFNQGPVTEYPMMQAKDGGWLNKYQSGTTSVEPRIKNQEEFLKNWYENRVIPEAFIQGAYDLDKPGYVQKVSNFPSITYVEKVPTPGNSGTPSSNGRVTGQYNQNANTVYITPYAQPSVPVHEFTHYVDRLPEGTYMNNIHKEIISREILPESEVPEQYKAKYSYYTDPEEVHARIMVLRQRAGFKPDEVITKEKLEDFLKNYNGDDENINDIISLSKGTFGLSNLLNYMAVNDSEDNGVRHAKYGGRLSKYQTGGLTNENLRADGTKKGTGYFGILDRPDGKVSTEISIGVNINGKEVEIPTMVPTLTKEELDYLLTSPVDKEDLLDTPIGQSIENKAVEYAKQRMSKGLNPFYQEGEQRSGLPRHLQNPGIASVYEENNKPDWTNGASEYKRGGTTWLNEYGSGGKVSKEELEYLQSVAAEDFQSNPRNTEIERQKAELTKKTQMSETSLDLEKEIAKQSLLSKLRELSGKNEESVDYYRGSTAPKEIIKNNYIYANPGDKVVTTTEGTMPRIKPVNAVDDGIFLAFADAVTEYKELYPNRPVPRISSGLRTRAEQEQLYANRANNRYPVAKPGTSKHELGKALDIVFDGGNDSDYQRLAALMSPRGFKWLGDYDKVHFEVDPNYPKTDISESGNIMITNQMPSMQLDVNRPAPRSFQDGGETDNNSASGSTASASGTTSAIKSTGFTGSTNVKPLINSFGIYPSSEAASGTLNYNKQLPFNFGTFNVNTDLSSGKANPSFNYSKDLRHGNLLFNKDTQSLNLNSEDELNSLNLSKTGNNLTYGTKLGLGNEETGIGFTAEGNFLFGKNQINTFPKLGAKLNVTPKTYLQGTILPGEKNEDEEGTTNNGSLQGEFHYGSPNDNFQFTTSGQSSQTGNILDSLNSTATYNKGIFNTTGNINLKNDVLSGYGLNTSINADNPGLSFTGSAAANDSRNINDISLGTKFTNDSFNFQADYNKKMGDELSTTYSGSAGYTSPKFNMTGTIGGNKQGIDSYSATAGYTGPRLNLSGNIGGNKQGINTYGLTGEYQVNPQLKATASYNRDLASNEQDIKAGLAYDFSAIKNPEAKAITPDAEGIYDYDPKTGKLVISKNYAKFVPQKPSEEELDEDESLTIDPGKESLDEKKYGGWLNKYAQGGKIFSAGGEKHRVYEKESPTGNGKGVKGHIMVTHPTMDKGKWDTIDLTKIAGAKTVAQGVTATKKWHAENPEYKPKRKLKTRK